jgi:hypothetical protein|nr:MAG TPA: hypothetical protein [Caudoviricetes sp.]
MTKPTIGTTKYGFAARLDQMARDAVVFLINNKSVVLDDADVDAIRSIRIATRTPMTDLFMHIVQAGKLSLFTALDLSRLDKQSVPELFSLNDITIDGKYVPGSIPPAFQSAWLNLTPILGKRDAYNSGLHITDIPTCASLFTRGMLCMSYNDSDAWLTPQICTFIIETYSSLISGQLSRYFNLAYDESKLVSTLFSAYYAQLLGGKDDPKDYPPLLYRCQFLGTPFDITERMKVLSDARNRLGADELSIDLCCKVLAEAGPARMKKMTADLVYVPLSRAAADSQAMLIALDYPPYWVYQLLTNIHGTKNPLLNNMLRNQELRKAALRLANELNLSKLFIEKVVR